MTRNRREQRAAMEALFAAERKLSSDSPESDEMRERVVERARVALARGERPWSLMRPVRRLNLGLAAAASVCLVALCAFAFQAGYRFRTVTPPVAKPTVVAPVVRPLAVSEVTESTPTVVEPGRIVVHAMRPKNLRALAASEAYVAELAVLQPALDAIARHDFSAALAPIVAHQKKFPSGQLAEEREGLRVKALVGLGRTSEAARAVADFRDRFPHSALLGQIQEIAGLEK